MLITGRKLMGLYINEVHFSDGDDPDTWEVKLLMGDKPEGVFVAGDDYIESQVAKELERVFDLGDSNMTNEEQAVLISYKAQQVAVNTINAIEKGDIF